MADDFAQSIGAVPVDAAKTLGAVPVEPDTPAKTGTTPTYLDRLVDWLPTLGGAAGGIMGGVGGTVAGAGVGGVPGAVGGAALGGMTGEALKELANRLRGRSAPSTAGEAAGAIGTQGGLQAGAELAGQGLGAAMSAVAPGLMQSAVKPTLQKLKEFGGTGGERIAQTLLDEGVNVTKGGLEKLQGLLTATNAEIHAAVANSSALIDPAAVAARTDPVVQRLAQQVNPTADLNAAASTVDAFMHHPSYAGTDGVTQPFSASEAQLMKMGTYSALRNKYGQLGSAQVETEKALARGLKEEIAAAVPGVSDLNARDSQLLNAADALGRRVALSGNANPIGFAAVAHRPLMFLTALADRSPAVKSMLANGLYQSAGVASGVAPQLIRYGVHQVAQPSAADQDGGQ